MKFRKKPVIIEAFRPYIDPDPEWFTEALAKGTAYFDYHSEFQEFILKIKTLEGIHECSPGDYIIKGVRGELYPCKPDIFEKTYERVE